MIVSRNPDAFKTKASLRTSGGPNEKSNKSQDIKDDKKLQETPASQSAPFHDPAIIEMRVASGNTKPNSRYGRQDSSSQQDRRQKHKEENRKSNTSESKFNKNKDRPTNRENKKRDIRGDRYFKNKIQDSDHSAKAKQGGEIKTNEDKSINKTSDNLKGPSHPESPSKTTKTSTNSYKSVGENKTATNNSDNVDKFRNRRTEKPNKADPKTSNESHKETNENPKSSVKSNKGPDRVDIKTPEKSAKITDRSWKQNKVGDKGDQKIIDKTNKVTDRSPKKFDKAVSKGTEKPKSDVENFEPKISPKKSENKSGNIEHTSKLDMNPSVLQRRKSFEGKQPEKYVESGRRNSLDSGNKNNDDEDGRDPRTERRIRNKVSLLKLFQFSYYLCNMKICKV